MLHFYKKKAQEEGLYPPPPNPPQELPTVAQLGPPSLFAQKVQNPGVRGPIEEHAVGMNPPKLSKLFGLFPQKSTWIRRVRRSFTYRRPWQAQESKGPSDSLVHKGELGSQESKGDPQIEDDKVIKQKSNRLFQDGTKPMRFKMNTIGKLKVMLKASMAFILETNKTKKEVIDRKSC